ncbi:DUF3164 family protein [Chryseobacterium salviniae]|uniref:DUF3164 family protein n=1 Tax=Chryseobacterium salviniae TaxID=3101750 RepID=A0ABU6HV35_9FLAO|nr:DUF3164 family protein [Chryseobacterium sp. T9W2-O]MEC3875965.1 DUF3164 family protein [Chryseobacterium sp. T9W2-O]
MTAIDITALSPEEKEKLAKQLREDTKAAKAKRESDLKSFKELSAEFVNRHIDPLVHHHEITGMLIEKLWNDYKPLQELKKQIYGIKTDTQDSHTSTLEDGSASITIGYNVTIGFDGTESAGVEKIKDFLKSLSTDEENVKKLSAAVNTFLKPNAKTGMLNPAKIIELSKLRSEFNDERFDEGLDIIMKAQQRRQNSMYVSGWKFIEVNEMKKRLDFRFTI